MSFTKEQNQAITSRERNLLVSASAGSGKTTVMIERILSLIEDGASLENMVVCTFTRSAASDMRDKLQNALLKRVGDGTEFSEVAERELLLLPTAEISTLHSWCQRLIRNYFYVIGADPAFEIADEEEAGAMLNAAVDEAVEEKIAAGDADFNEFYDVMLSGRTDYALKKLVREVYYYAEAQSDPEAWFLSTATRGLNVPAQSEAVIEEAKIRLKERFLPRAKDLMSRTAEAGFKRNYAAVELLVENILTGGSEPIPTPTGRIPDEFRGLNDEYQALKKAYAKAESALTEFFEAPVPDERTRTFTRILLELTASAKDKYAEEKKRRARLDYSDLEHLTVKLVENPECAAEIRERYRYIFVDEYQDVNPLQERIISALGGASLFLVGDVKQSIYRFRQAMPEIFMEKLDRYGPFDGKNYPAKIILGKNFRSRPEVTEFVNFVFRQLMSQKMGEMEYSREQELIPAADYPPDKQMQAELHLIDIQEEKANSVQLEAAYVARRIARLMTDGSTVWENGAPRPVRFGDVCILLRSPKNKAQVYREAFLKEGINSWSDSRNGFLQAREIRVMVAFLQMLDNPYRDIPLLTVLMSDLFGFTPDQIAKIRLLDQRGSFYSALQESARQGDESSAAFLRQTQLLRRLAVSMPVAGLLTEIYARTDYPAIVSAYPMGQARKANLHQLCSFAAAFEKSGGRGLYAFVRFLDRLSDQKADFEPASSGGGSDAVQILSIHRSKGLEFPYVFLCDGAKAFNKQDLRDRIAVHPQMGFACVRRDSALLKEFTTVPLEALRLENERAGLSEELRVLYVALTRAKEKLFITMSGNVDKMLQKASLAAQGPLQPFVVRSADSIGAWLLMCALRHPDCHELRARCLAVWQNRSRRRFKLCLGKYRNGKHWKMMRRQRWSLVRTRRS